MRLLTDYKQFFKTIADELGYTFIFGGSHRLLNMQNEQITYPVLFLDIPDIPYLRDGGVHKFWQGGFAVLEQKDADDFAGHDLALDLMLIAFEKVIQKMIAASEASPPLFDFDIEGIEAEAIGFFTADDLWGWRTDFMLKGAMCENDLIE